MDFAVQQLTMHLVQIAFAVQFGDIVEIQTIIALLQIVCISATVMLRFLRRLLIRYNRPRRYFLQRNMRNLLQFLLNQEDLVDRLQKMLFALRDNVAQRLGFAELATIIAS